MFCHLGHSDHEVLVLYKISVMVSLLSPAGKQVHYGRRAPGAEVLFSPTTLEVMENAHEYKVRLCTMHSIVKVFWESKYCGSLG